MLFYWLAANVVSMQCIPSVLAYIRMHNMFSYVLGVVVDLCENGTAVDSVSDCPYTTSPHLPVSSSSHQGSFVADI